VHVFHYVPFLLRPLFTVVGYFQVFNHPHLCTNGNCMVTIAINVFHCLCLKSLNSGKTELFGSGLLENVDHSCVTILSGDLQGRIAAF